MKCQNCGSKNIVSDIAAIHQVIVKKDGTHVNILADLCKDCGTIRRYVKDKDEEYASREEASQKEKKYFDELKIESDERIVKQKRLGKILIIIGTVIMGLSLICQYAFSAFFFARVLLVISMFIMCIGVVLS